MKRILQKTFRATAHAPCTSVFIFAFVLLFLYVHPVHAQWYNPLSWFGDVATAAAEAIAYVVGWTLKWLLTFIFGLMAYLLEKALRFTVSVVPSQITAVQLGWAALRDFANAFFILILLWIAFTIIFNIEHLGGKKLLFRVIGVALLVNFSLVGVTALFALTNQAALAIFQAYPTSVATFITDSLSINQLDTVLTEAKSSAAQSGVTITDSGQKETQFVKLSSDLFAGLGINNEANAFHSGGLFGAFTFANFGESPSEAAIRAAGIKSGVTKNDQSGGNNSKISNNAEELKTIWMAVVFLLFASATAGMGALTLLIRVIVMVVLSVVAPLVFLAYTIPAKNIQGHFTKWLQSIGSWAIFAPLFFLFFYLALLIMGQGKVAFAIDPGKDMDRWVILILSLGFMIAAIKLAKTTAKAIIDTGMSWAKGAGMLALGGVGAVGALGAGALLRKAAPALDKGAEKLSQSNWLVRKATAPVTGRYRDYMEGQKAKAAEKGKKYASWDPKRQAQEYTGAFDPMKKVGIAKNLVEKGKISELSDTQIRQVSSLAGRIDPEVQKKIYASRPDLIPQEKYKETLAQLDSKDMKVDWKNVGRGASADVNDPVRAQMRGALMTDVFRTGDRNKLREMNDSMLRQDPETRNAMRDSMKKVYSDKANWQSVKDLDPVAYEEYARYMNNNPAAKLVGATLPPEVQADVDKYKKGKKTASGPEQKRAEIQNLIQQNEADEEQVARLEQIGEEKRANLLRTEIEQSNSRIARLSAEIAELESGREQPGWVPPRRRAPIAGASDAPQTPAYPRTPPPQQNPGQLTQNQQNALAIEDQLRRTQRMIDNDDQGV